MKKALGILLSLPLFFLFSLDVSAQTAVCNTRCQVNEDCGTGYRCYVGVCRNTLCPSSNTCGCTASPTPASSVRPTATPKATASAKPSASPTPKTATKSTSTASISGLQRTPNTGFETLIPVGISLALYGVGSLLVKEKSR